MIEIIKDFHNIDFSDLMNESIFISNGDKPITQCIQEVYDKGKEVAVNLNDEIQRLVISDTDTFIGVIHRTAYDILNMTSININVPLSDEEKAFTINVQMTGSDIKARLCRIPDLILTTINYLTQYANDHEITENIIRTVHDHIEVMSKAALELIALTKMNNKSLTESSVNSENVNDYISELNKIISEIRNYYDKSDYAKILSPRKKKYDKMVEYMKGALERKYTLRIPLYKVENADKTTRDIVENKFIKDVQGIISKYKNYALLSPNWNEDEDIYIYLTLKEPFGKDGDKQKRSLDSADDVMEKFDNNKFNTNSNNKNDDSLNEAFYAHEYDSSKSKEYNNIKTKLSQIYNRVERLSNMNDPRVQGQVDKLMDEADDLKNKLHNLNESTTKLTKAERDALPDSEFGLPELRKYPLNDEEHIKEAIKFFHFCSGKNKPELAKNISNKVKKLKLIGKVTVSKKNPFKKYFPDWMIENDGTDDSKKKIKKAKVPKTQNESTVVFINDKLI